MNLLFPLFLAGGLAVLAPVVFHMIRRTPSGKRPFGSLMFLTESPPRFVRRQKLEHVGLLLLRALAIALLALAFARPFLPAEERVALESSEVARVAILLDTSASMQRAELWSAARSEVELALDEVPAAATVSLITFGRAPRTLLRDASVDRVRAALADFEPSWEATDLGLALTETAEELFAAEAESGRAGRSGPRGRTGRIVLVSDLQAGAAVGDLNDYDWPERVELELRPVAAPAGNASLQIAPSTARDDELRVRVTNTRDATAEDFSLQWITADAAPIGDALRVSCPPGESRVVRAPQRRLGTGSADSVTALVLSGDGVPFDNVVHHLVASERLTRVVAPAPDATVEQDLAFYLGNVFGQAALDPAGTAPDANEHALLVQRPGERSTAEVLAFARAGGVVLIVLTGDEGTGDGAGVADEQTLRELLAVPALSLGEAGTPRGFSLLGEIAFDHALFAPFDDPRYSDFTKVHFWRHRALALPSDGSGASAVRVLARFDDGLPFLVERRVEGGRILVATSGWQARDSDFARSTKFAPLLLGMTKLGREIDPALSSLRVGDPVPLPANSAELLRPDGRRVALAEDATLYQGTDLPGPWDLIAGGKTTSFLVTLDPSESRIERMDADLFARSALPVQAEKSDAQIDALAERERQELGIETEGRQKLWRWLLLAVLATLLVETVWAGRIASRMTPQETQLSEGAG